MALWDTADLLLRAQRYARQPSVAEWPAVTDWYAWLTEAESKWKRTLAHHDPAPMMEDPVQLTSADSGLTYQFPTSVRPIYFEVYTALNGPPLVPGAFHDPDADYVDESTQIRMCRGRTRTFSDGPYARYVAPAAAISAGVDSTILPAQNRILLVYDALERFASAGGGVQDPNYWRSLLRKELYGDPEIPGDHGILGGIARRDAMYGYAAIAGPKDRTWYRPV